MVGRKERKRISLKREYIGDYIGFLDNPSLRTLVGTSDSSDSSDSLVLCLNCV